MAEIDWLAVHERATPDDALNTASLALTDRRFGNTTLPKRAVKPDPVGSALGALSNEVEGDVRMGSHNNGVDRLRNGAEVRVAPYTFDFSGVRIDREHVVPGVA
jgi:hypothetical protein